MNYFRGSQSVWTDRTESFEGFANLRKPEFGKNSVCPYGVPALEYDVCNILN